MTKPKRINLSLKEELERIKSAGIKTPQENNMIDADEISESLECRINNVLGLINSTKRKHTNMTYFIMYDIENNKVRRLISKYLIKEGCTRIQRSIFLADSPKEKYEEIKQALTDVQSFYENHDSILVVPISTEYISAMKVIGQSINIDLILKNKNTLFF